MSEYIKLIEEITKNKNSNGASFGAVNPEFAARMKLQNKFPTGLDIARYTSDIMHQDIKDYDKDNSLYTQSLG
ncbi:uncharacterized protein METZ01_LOCUS381525, partial [marine metagenome]